MMNSRPQAGLVVSTNSQYGTVYGVFERSNYSVEALGPESLFAARTRRQRIYGSGLHVIGVVGDDVLSVAEIAMFFRALKVIATREGASRPYQDDDRLPLNVDLFVKSGAPAIAALAGRIERLRLIPGIRVRVATFINDEVLARQLVSRYLPQRVETGHVDFDLLYRDSRLFEDWNFMAADYVAVLDRFKMRIDRMTLSSDLVVAELSVNAIPAGKMIVSEILELEAALGAVAPRISPVQAVLAYGEETLGQSGGRQPMTRLEVSIDGLENRRGVLRHILEMARSENAALIKVSISSSADLKRQSLHLSIDGTHLVERGQQAELEKRITNSIQIRGARVVFRWIRRDAGARSVGAL